MKWIIGLLVTLILPLGMNAQKGYSKEIKSFWRSHKSGLQQKFDGPLKTKDLKQLDFYEADMKWKVKARINREASDLVLQMPTSANKIKEYKVFGYLQFELGGDSLKVPVYEMAGKRKESTYVNYLFLPFTDLTNGVTTYGGGRYLDLDKTEIEDGYLWVDFNKAYNPYCAYADGWNCPIPPVKNRIDLAIEAGEKIYNGPRRERK